MASIVIEGDSEIVIGGVRCSAAVLEALFLEPPQHLLLNISREKIDSTAFLVCASFATAESAAEFFKDKPADWRDRVREEKQQLDANLERLEAFLRDRPHDFNSLPVDERSRLIAQRDAMLEYSRILAQRIEAFEKSDARKTGGD